MLGTVRRQRQHVNKSSIAASSAAIAITEDVNTSLACAAISRSVVGVMASRFLALGTVSLVGDRKSLGN